MNKERQDPVIRALEAEKRKLEKEIKRLDYLIYDYFPIKEEIEVIGSISEALNKGDYGRAVELEKRLKELKIEVENYLRRDPAKLIDQQILKSGELEMIKNEIYFRQMRIGKPPTKSTADAGAGARVCAHAPG